MIDRSGQEPVPEPAGDWREGMRTGEHRLE